MRVYNNAFIRARKKHGSLFPDLFIERSMNKITQERIDRQGITLSVDGKYRFTLNTKMSKRDIKAVIKSI